MKFGFGHPQADDQVVIRTATLATVRSAGAVANEELVGEALQPIRDKVVIATKFGFDIELETGKRGAGTNSRPEHIKRWLTLA